MKPVYPFGGPVPGDDVLWRCEARTYSTVVDAEAEVYGFTPPRLEMLWFPVLRRTPKGAWIGWHDFDGATKFVRLNAHKRWACETQEEALESFRRRKKKQISILQAKLTRAQSELAFADGVSIL